MFTKDLRTGCHLGHFLLMIPWILSGPLFLLLLAPHLAEEVNEAGTARVNIHKWQR